METIYRYKIGDRVIVSGSDMPVGTIRERVQQNGEQIYGIAPDGAKHVYNVVIWEYWPLAMIEPLEFPC